jgi:membrane-associated phospholipid phosphatase
MFLYIPLISNAQKISGTVGEDIKYGTNLAINSLKKPVEKPIKTGIFLGVISAGTVLAITQDTDFYLATQSGKNTIKDFVAHRLGEPFGNAYYQALALGGLYISSKLLHQEALNSQSTVLLTSAALTGTSVVVLKAMFSRARPYTTDDARAFFNGNVLNDGYQSFPSAHTALAFSLASSLTHLNPDKVWIPLVFYPLAGLTAWSRMYDEQHWLSDVLLGAVVGHLIGKTVAQQHNKFRLSVGSGAFGGLSAGFQLNF